MKKYLFQLITLVLFSIVSANSNVIAQEKKAEWHIPAEYKNMKNPVKYNEANLDLGKQQYNKHCAGCHGKTGKGDGEKTQNAVNASPANLSLDKFATETDGEHFFKIKEGRNKLHCYKTKLDDESIWAIVHYMKTFKK